MQRLSPFVCCVLALGVASGALAVPEVEPNDSFASRQVLSPGDTSLEGGLEDVFSSFDESRGGLLVEGVVDSYTISGASPSVPFTAWIENFLLDPDPDFDPDTILGEFNASGALVDSNDDSSPVGDTFASALAGTVNSDGTIRLKVTGWADFDFDGQDDFLTGPHLESGSYTLFVRIGTAPDVDYVTFTGLAPGQPFDAEIVSAEFDTVMGRFNDSSILVDFNDDIDPDAPILRSQLLGDVPPSGELHLAISQFGDANFDGEVEETLDELPFYQVGAYDLVLRVPEPRSPWLLVSALAGVVGLARRRGFRDILPAPQREESP